MGPGLDTRVDVPALKELVVRPLPGMAKQRTVFRLSGVCGRNVYAVHNNNLTNLRRGIVERVLRVPTSEGLKEPPRPLQGVFAERLRGVTQLVAKRLPQSTPVARDKYPELYVGRLRSVYEAAVKSLEQAAVERRDSWVKPFVKAENVRVVRVHPDGSWSVLDPAPRVIQPRSPRYNVEVGRYLKLLEKPILRAVDKAWGGPTVLKGMNAAGVGRELSRMWGQFKEPIGVGLDMSRFDQHVSAQALAWEHSIYLRCFQGYDREELSRLLSWQLRNTGRSWVPDGKVRYEVEGCRMSGDINTSLGNCLIMACMGLAYCTEKRISARLANHGDDCVFIMEKRDYARFMAGAAEWFREMGFTAVIEAPVYELEQVVFCQCSPIWTPEGYLMCRNPFTALAKDSTTLLPLKQKGMVGKWMGAIGACGLSLSGGVPVFQAWYLSLLRKAGGQQLHSHATLLTGLYYMGLGMQRKVSDVHPRTRYSFWVAFGLDPREQLSLEQHFQHYDPCCTLVPRVFEVDPLAHPSVS